MTDKKLWFKNKRSGWGWYPASWEGWVVLLVWIAAFGLGEVLFITHMNATPSATAVVLFLAYVLLTVSLLIYICYKKGEKPRWQWGIPKEKDKKY